MDARNAYEELLAVTAVAIMFLALGYVLLTGHGIGDYIGVRAEASGYPGVHVISETVSTFRMQQPKSGARAHVIHDRLREWPHGPEVGHGPVSLIHGNLVRIVV